MDKHVDILHGRVNCRLFSMIHDVGHDVGVSNLWCARYGGAGTFRKFDYQQVIMTGKR